MRRRYRYLLTGLAGILAGSLGYVGAEPALERGTTAFVVGLNAVIWAIAVGLYLFVYEQLDSPEGRPDWEQQYRSGVMGGVAGLVCSLEMTGTMALLTILESFRVGAVVGLFVFGTILASMAVGMQATLWRYDGETPGSGRSSGETRSDPSD